MSFQKLLAVMVEKGGSDMFVTAGVPPCVKLNGRMTPLTNQVLNGEQAKELVLGVMDAEQRSRFLAERECNFAIQVPKVGRFRVSAFQQRNQYGMVLRRIETTIPTLEALSLPPQLAELIMHKRGLLILVGATGTGKSSTLAAMIGHRNRNSNGHIITIEDPIEFIHQHDKSIITQREVGIDTESFDIALKNTLRQAPDVILIGEIRSQETMEYALTFAETGHLCLATLHANNANQALDRIMHFFPEERHPQTLMDLSLNLRAIVAQQLATRADGKGRHPGIAVLINSPLASDLIRKGEVHKLKELMGKSRELGMQTFDQALFELFSRGVITYEEAMHHADSPNDLRLMIKLSAKQSGQSFDDPRAEGMDGLSLVDD